MRRWEVFRLSSSSFPTLSCPLHLTSSSLSLTPLSFPTRLLLDTSVFSPLFSPSFPPLLPLPVSPTHPLSYQTLLKTTNHILIHDVQGSLGHLCTLVQRGVSPHSRLCVICSRLPDCLADGSKDDVIVFR